MAPDDKLRLEQLAPRKRMAREVAHSDRWGVSADRQHVATGREDVVAIRKAMVQRFAKRPSYFLDRHHVGTLELD